MEKQAKEWDTKKEIKRPTILINEWEKLKRGGIAGLKKREVINIRRRESERIIRA